MKCSTADIAIQLTNVTKRYTIHHEKPTLVERLTNGKDEEFWALKDINITIKKGERVGIIGPNGSGKTTLLKIIAGIATPTRGTVTTNGRLVSLIDLEAGFHSEMTGEQNIYLSSLILGMSKKETKKKLDKIIKYADIKEFIDVPLYTYSSGMRLRLGFSIAIHCEPDILLFDEAINFGDQNFKDKMRYDKKMIFNRQKTIIMVTHDLYTVADYCERVIILKGKTILYNDGLNSIVSYYNKFPLHKYLRFTKSIYGK